MKIAKLCKTMYCNAMNCNELQLFVFETGSDTVTKRSQKRNQTATKGVQYGFICQQKGGLPVRRPAIATTYGAYAFSVVPPEYGTEQDGWQGDNGIFCAILDRFAWFKLVLLAFHDPLIDLAIAKRRFSIDKAFCLDSIINKVQSGRSILAQHQ